MTKTDKKRITIAEYLRRKDMLYYTHLVMRNEGIFYVHDGVEIPEEEFRKMHELPESLVKNNSENVDGTKAWGATL